MLLFLKTRLHRLSNYSDSWFLFPTSNQTGLVVSNWIFSARLPFSSDLQGHLDPSPWFLLWCKTSSSEAATSTSVKRKYGDRVFQADLLTYAWPFGNLFDLFVVEVNPLKSNCLHRHYMEKNTGRVWWHGLMKLTMKTRNKEVLA